MKSAHRKSETRLAGRVIAKNTQENTAEILPETADASKREQSLIAKFALCGHAVHRLADGGFLICRWSYSRHVPDYPALVGIARQMGVSQ